MPEGGNSPPSLWVAKSPLRNSLWASIHRYPSSSSSATFSLSPNPLYPLAEPLPRLSDRNHPIILDPRPYLPYNHPEKQILYFHLSRGKSITSRSPSRSQEAEATSGITVPAYQIRSIPPRTRICLPLVHSQMDCPSSSIALPRVFKPFTPGGSHA